MEQPERYKDGRDPVLDFWRGISIILVIESHLVFFRFHSFFVSLGNTAYEKNFIRAFLTVSWHAGDVGVKIFLVISGFLITKILISELDRTGSISIAKFYLRRFFRIIPAYAGYLLGMGLFAALGWTATIDRSNISCIAFLANASATPCTWNLLHLWSLSVEEQFYAVWPLFILLLPALRRTPTIAALCVLFSVFSAFKIFFMHGWIDNGWAFASIAGGALYAASSTVRHYVNIPSAPLTGVSALFMGILFLVSAKTSHAPEQFAYALLSSFAILRLIMALRHIPRFLASRAFHYMRNIGLASYSLYLWQQPFTNNPAFYRDSSPLSMPLFLVPVALISYHMLEKPIHSWSSARFRTYNNGNY